MIKYFITIAAAGFLGAALAMPATAQSQIEFGYKDRIFDQNYLLPETMTKAELEELATRTAMLSVLNPAIVSAPANPRAKSLLGGNCAKFAIVQLLAPISLTAPDLVFSFFPPAVKSNASSTLMVAVTCEVQTLAFYGAFADPASTEPQLKRLAAHIRNRFADDWLANDEIADPSMQRAIKQFAELRERAGPLLKAGMFFPEAVWRPLDKGTLAARLRAFASGAVSYDELSKQLSAMETEPKRDKQSFQAEQKSSKEDEERRAYRDQLIADAEASIDRAREFLEGAKEEARSAVMRAEMNPTPDTRSVAFHRERVARAEVTLNAAIADRDKLLAHLARLDNRPGAVPTQAARGSVSSSPHQPGMCEAGQRCQTSERTIFCRTLDDVRAVLARPIGAERRGILAALKARGACTLIEGGVDVVPKGKIYQVTPIGEAPVGVVQATASTGQSGFLLASALASQVLMTTLIKSDIQMGICVTAIIGGFILLGLGHLMGKVGK